jgi:soluble P-type ATPase
LIELNIPGRETMRLEHLVSDVNGTLALDGELIEGVAGRLTTLSDRLHLHLLTADTHGKQSNIDQILQLEAVRIPKGQEAAAKAAYVNDLGAGLTVAIGQGANDAGMLEAACLGLVILSPEGTARTAFDAADVYLPDILSALDLLIHPLRLVATLRQ